MKQFSLIHFFNRFLAGGIPVFYGITYLFLAVFELMFNSYREFPLKEHESLVCWFCGGYFPAMCVCVFSKI